MSGEQAKKTAKGPAVPEATVQTGGNFQVGDQVQHVDDPMVHGKVTAVREDGRVHIEGTANALPAEKLKPAKKG